MKTLLPLQGIQFGQPGARTGSCWITAAEREKLSPASDPLPLEDTPAPSGLRLGMHHSIVIVAWGRGQSIAANGVWRVPSGVQERRIATEGSQNGTRKVSCGPPQGDRPRPGCKGWNATGFGPGSAAVCSLRRGCANLDFCAVVRVQR